MKAISRNGLPHSNGINSNHERPFILFSCEIRRLQLIRGKERNTIPWRAIEHSPGIEFDEVEHGVSFPKNDENNNCEELHSNREAIRRYVFCSV